MSSQHGGHDASRKGRRKAQLRGAAPHTADALSAARTRSPDDESPRSPSFAEQIALAADELQSPRSPTFEEQITGAGGRWNRRRHFSPLDSPRLPPDLFFDAATTTVAGRSRASPMVLRVRRRWPDGEWIADLHGNAVCMFPQMIDIMATRVPAPPRTELARTRARSPMRQVHPAERRAKRVAR